MQLSFERLPEAVGQLYDKLENIERLLSVRVTSNVEIDQLLTIEKAADVLSLSKQTVYGLVSRTEVPFMKKGKRLYFSQQELMEWIRTGRRKTVAENASDVDAYLNSSKKKGGLYNGK